MVHFQNIKNVLLGSLSEAERDIWVAVAWFTDRDLLASLQARLRVGVRVRVILLQDDINFGQYGLDFSEFKRLGGELVAVSKELMHNKFCIIDKKKVLSGSYNWTFRAANQNKENLIVIKEGEMVAEFCREFADLFARYTGREMVYQEGLGINLYLKSLQQEIKFLDQEISLLETEKESIFEKISRFLHQQNVYLYQNLKDLLHWRTQAAAQKAAQTQKQADKQQFEALKEEAKNFESNFSKNFENESENAQNADFEAQQDTRSPHFEPPTSAQNDLKSLFREIAKRCHPDRVRPEHEAAARKIFEAAQKAKAKGDKARLQQILETLKAGIAFGYDIENITEIELLEKLKKERLLQKEKLLEEIATLQAKKEWQILTSYQDLKAYFEEIKNQILTEIENLMKFCGKFKSEAKK
ncbi:phospholipase D-like domain-containing protein [Hugenholtzia roseola]|uniref:phospholipase D-like domain-containing protein n=1 Tax=Hugenholtzia roseola TaxID=1002 RepID=UPI0012B66A36|nr:phospholipase D-like domain-containing protein [Hugenholtzia roseola]